MKVNLVAVQAKTELSDYRSHGAFRSKMTSLMEKAMHEVDPEYPTLVTYPEVVGLYLNFVPYYWEDLKHHSNLMDAGMKLVMKNLEHIPEAELASPEKAARRLLFVDHAMEAEKTYFDTFSALAREYRAYVAAGSIATPPMDYDPYKGGRYMVDDKKVRNTSYFFSPKGVCLRRVPKVYLHADAELRLFDPGPKSELAPVVTRLGRVGTLVCEDALHTTLVEHYDAQAVDIVLQPSYNMEKWDGPSRYGVPGTEGEARLATSLIAQIQGRENIQYGVEAFMVGAVFEDMMAEGMSYIARNTGEPGAPWENAVVAMAEKPDAEEIVAATVDVAGFAARPET